MIPKFPAHPKPQETSQVLAIEHDPETKKLTVTFHGNRTYVYDNVSRENVAKLRAAPSKGSFMNEHIIPHHNFEKVAHRLAKLS